MIEKIRVLLWTIRYYPQYTFSYWKTLTLRKQVKIYTSQETIKRITLNHYSVCRFGDGELQMMDHYKQGGTSENFNVDTFQGYSKELAARLWEVFLSSGDRLIICLPYQFKDAYVSTLRARMFWQREWLGRLHNLHNYITNRQFGDTNFTRFYMSRRDIKDYPQYIKNLKSIWNSRQIVIVEGTGSRAGVGNDLFNGAKSIKRIICPAHNAFSSYSDILKHIENFVEKKSLVLLCLGHTATVLAYDLSQLGYQAIDLGHVDIEYEWYRMGAKSKVAVPDKYVNEVSQGRVVSKTKNEDYTSQIIANITRAD